jgi:2-polyprenyl-3-methyl-5-hydroxy-6-metoxy-1,4-benzoquinol methylase
MSFSQTLQRILRPHTDFTPTQTMFQEWNAERLGISLEESRKRYVRSRRAFPRGHVGRGYRAFNDTAYEVLQVFFSDTPAEAFTAYVHHSPMHFLMMLGYKEPTREDNEPLIRALNATGKREKVSILDFGCGLAQQSRTLAANLIADGVQVSLTLADIPTLRKDFLVWLTKRMNIPTTFLECTAAAPIPDALPPCDVLFATEFFEHVHDPMKYFERFHPLLSPGGIMITNLADHHEEFMHVSPNLKALRDRVASLGYVELAPSRLYRKPI